MATSTSHLPPLLPAPPLPTISTSTPPPFPSPRHLCPSPPIRLLRAARRRHPDAVVVVPDTRPWIGDLTGAASYQDGSEEDEDEEEEDDEDEDRSLDLLVRFLHAMFRKASRRARRAARSVLPPSVPAELVKFSVNGVLVLTFLWILKGLLEVICTFGSMVFASILLVRGIWSGVTYIRETDTAIFTSSTMMTTDGAEYRLLVDRLLTFSTSTHFESKGLMNKSKFVVEITCSQYSANCQ